MKRLLLESYFGKIVIATGGMGLSMILSYGFHGAMVRLLSPNSYGNLSILAAFFMIATLPAMSIQGLMSREIAKLDGKDEDRINNLIKKYLKKTIIWGCVAAFVLSSAGLMVTGSLSVLTIAMVLTFFSIPFAYASGIINGYYQGREKLFELAAVFNAPVFLRLIVAFSLVVVGFDIIGASASFLLGFLLIIPAIAFVHGWFSKEKGSIGLDVDESFVRVLGTNMFMMIFISCDLFMVWFLKGGEMAAYYNAAAVTSRIPFYISTSVVFVLLPQASKLTFSDRKELAVRFMKSLLLVIPFAPLFALASYPLLSLLYKPAYAEMGAGAFAILGVAMVVLGVANLLVNILWSQRKETVPLLLSAILIPVQVILLYMLIPGRNLEGAAIATLITSALFLVGSTFAVIYYSLSHKA